MVAAITFNVLEGDMQSNVVVLGFSLLNKHHFFDCRDQVEFLDVFSEFTALDLGVV